MMLSVLLVLVTTTGMSSSSSSSSLLPVSNAFSLASVVPLRKKPSSSSAAAMSMMFSSFHHRKQNKKNLQNSPHVLDIRGGSSSIRSSSASDSSDSSPSLFTKLRQFGSKNFFLVGMFIAVGVAKLLPALGKDGGLLRSELFIGKFGVSLIFLLSGLSLEVSELTQAISNYKLNTSIQLSTFLLWPFLIGVPMKNLLLRLFSQTTNTIFPKPLIDGILILTCLPTTVNMCIMLTSASGGNVATSICNAVISNLLGIFATPALLFYFFGTQITLPFVDMVIKLCNKVLLPVAIGQALRLTQAKDIYAKNSKFFKRLQEVK